jgi:hypothetical protein
MDDFLAAVGQCAEEYEKEYKPELVRRQQERQQQEQRRQAAELERLRADRGTAAGSSGGAAAAGGAAGSSGSGQGRKVLDGRKGATLQQLQEEGEELAGLD